MLITGIVLFAGGGEARAQYGAAPETVIAEVLEDEAFEIHKEKFKVFKDKEGNTISEDRGSSAEDSMGMRALGDLIFWLVIIAAVAGFGWLIYSNRHLFGGRGLVVPEAPRPRARTVMGMDIAEETLPDDIPAAALDAFGEGDVGRAMCLLYRGSLSWMVETEGLPVHESDTEGDCVEHSRAMSEPVRVSFFGRLTEVWTAFAYGDSMPREEQVRRAVPELALRSWERGGAMNWRKGKLLLASLGVAVASGILGGCDQREMVEEERTIGYLGEARRDPFLACKRMLERLEYRIDRSASLTRLPEDGGTLVLAARAVTNYGATASLERWVRDGGHLIYCRDGTRRVTGAGGEELFAGARGQQGRGEGQYDWRWGSGVKALRHRRQRPFRLGAGRGRRGQ